MRSVPYSPDRCVKTGSVMPPLDFYKYFLKYNNNSGPQFVKTNKNNPCVQRRLRSVLPIRMKKAWVLSFPLSTQRRLGSACAGWSESSLCAKIIVLVLLFTCSKFNICSSSHLPFHLTTSFENIVQILGQQLTVRIPGGGAFVWKRIEYDQKENNSVT